MSSSPIIAKRCTNLKARQFARALTRLFDTELAKSGLKATQFSLLAKIYNGGPVSPSNLALRMELDKSSLTRNLRPLQEAGLVIQDVGSDARNRLISLTQAGRDKYTEANLHWNAAEKTIGELLGTERINAIHTLVDESLDLIHAAAILRPNFIDN
ncbi:MAG: MarR family winged helix-turn-helix transcriptional regulator [Methylotenera sp.]|nr:MarR family winged helix-turn-helix transcriptional regulator [Methylotenera sp.]